jgi:hypothetical protein
MPTVTASCLCHAVRWEIDTPLAGGDAGDVFNALQMSHCHCSRCRKAHGAPYATYLMVREHQLRITQGLEQIVRYPSSPGMFRPFCGACGSVVPDGQAWNGWVGTPAGPLDGDPGLRPSAHIFAGSKAPWVDLADGLPAHAAYPDGIPMQAMPTRAPLDPETGEPRGSCLCGEVGFVLTKAPLRCRTCHCSRCRKSLSAAHGTYLATALDGVRFTRGADRVRRFKVPDAQHFAQCFCGGCGSPMPRTDAGRGITLVPMGSLDDDPGVRPQSHIYVASMAPWDVISDDLPRFDAAPPG